MGFSREIRNEILIATARRCCICKKFTGLNIELHHIIPKNDGGEDTYDNAIPLCFDCHADVGHYNTQHPKGTKYSPAELRGHRDEWYKKVENGSYTLKNDVDISQQFLLTDSFQIVSEIVNGDFSNFPFNEILLYQNELYHYLKDIDFFSKREYDYKNHYGSIENYKSNNPDAQLVTDKYGVSQWTRIPSKLELKTKFFKTDYIVNYMLRNNAFPVDFSIVIYNEIGCYESSFETYFLSKAKVVFLAIFNTSEKAITVEKIEETFIDDGGFLNLDKISQEVRVKETNNLLFESGKCLLIPYCILLFGLNDEISPGQQIIYQRLQNEQSQDVRTVKLVSKGEIATIGVRNIVKQIQFEQDGFSSNFGIKPLDPSNLLMASRFWECGSCPHLFGRIKEGKTWEYIGELFSNTPSLVQEYVYRSEHYEFDQLKIVEIENEITDIEYISIDSVRIVENLRLLKGDKYTIQLRKDSIVKIRGKYTLIDGVYYADNQTKKQQKIVYYAIDKLNRL